MYIVLFVVFLHLLRWIFFCVGEFFYPLNSLNRARICAGIPYSVQRDLQKQDRVIARFSCYSTHTHKSGHCTKFCQILSTHDFLVICLWCRTARWRHFANIKNMLTNFIKYLHQSSTDYLLNQYDQLRRWGSEALAYQHLSLWDVITLKNLDPSTRMIQTVILTQQWPTVAPKMVHRFKRGWMINSKPFMMISTKH